MSIDQIKPEEGATLEGVTTIKAVVRGGRIELPEPLDLPDGTVVTIAIPTGLPRSPGCSGETVREEDETDAETIAERLRQFDALEPLVMTEEERQEAEEYLRESERYAIEKMNREVETLFP